MQVPVVQSTLVLHVCVQTLPRHTKPAAQLPFVVHGPERSVPAALLQTGGVGPCAVQAMSHRFPAPHAAEPASVMSVQDFWQYLPPGDVSQLNDPKQPYPPGQSESAVQSILQAKTVVV
jgi:hypothetical protein